MDFEVTWHNRDRLGEAELPAARCDAGRDRAVSRETDEAEAAFSSGIAVPLHDGDGGLRRIPRFGSPDAGTRARGPAGSADLREAVRQAELESRDGCGGTLRGGAAADPAVRGGEDGGSTSRRDAVPDPRPAGAPANRAPGRSNCCVAI